MTSIYFKKLATQSRKLDEGIENLLKTWEMPQVLSLINSTGECTESIDSHVEGVWDVIKNAQEEVRKLRLEVENENEQDSVPRILEKAEEEYEILKEECDNLETVFAEYGYSYDLDQTNGNDSKSNDQTFVEETENLGFENTPGSRWKTEEKDALFTPASTGGYKPRTTPFMTPQNDNSEFIDNSFISNQSNMFTPGGTQRPPEPIYSKHFYNLLKK